MSRKPLAILLAAGLALSPFALVARASAQTVKPQDRNAAIQYATIFYMADADLLSKASELDMTKVGFDKAALPDDFKAVTELVKVKGDGPIGQLLEASRLRKCDFELAMEKGIMVLMPHLGKMRSAARLLRVDARRHLLDGDAAGAAERLAAIVRIGQHAKNDDLLISSLVCLAIEAAAIDETEAQLATGLLTPEAKATIAGAFNAIPAQDPFAVKAAIRGEQRTFLGWVRDAFHGPDAGKQLAQMSSFGNEGPIAPAMKSVSAMTDEQIRASVDLLAPYYDKVIAAWDAPDGTEQLVKLAAKLDAGEYGPMGQVFAPAVSRARERDFQAQSKLAAIREKLASK